MPQNEKGVQVRTGTPLENSSNLILSDDLTKNEIAAYFRQRLPSLKQSSQKEWRGKCPVHDGKDLNFAVNPEDGRWYCFSQCGRGGDVFSLEMELGAVDFVKAKAEVFRLIGKPLPNWQERDIEATYDYTDESGNVLYQVVRKTGKQFWQRRPSGEPRRWIRGLGNVKAVPFHLPQMLKAELVSLAEGEKDVLSLERIGWPATCNNGGAGNFKPELVPYFVGKHVAIFRDNDEPGRKHALGVGQLLYQVAASFRIV